MPSVRRDPDGLRVGILCHPTHGGSGSLACELALNLAARGHEVHVFSHAVPPRLRATSARAALDLHVCEAPPYPLFEAPPHDLAMVSRILGVALDSGLDVLHAHYALPHAASAILAAEAVRQNGRELAVVTTLHGTDITVVGCDPAFAQVVRFLINRSDAVTCVSEALAQETRDTFFEEGPAPPIEVIPNFVNAHEFHARHVRAPGPPRIVHASNLRAVKRVPWLIEAFAQATEPDSGASAAELWVIGDGPQRKQAEARAEELGVAGRVRFLGQLDAVAPLFAGAAAFALASETESFGLSALEAMACGVPTVACRVGGLPELVTHEETGYLVDSNDQASFASRLRMLCVDHERVRTMGLAAARRATHHFASTPLVDRYEELYKRARGATLLIGGERWRKSESI